MTYPFRSFVYRRPAEIRRYVYVLPLLGLAQTYQRTHTGAISTLVGALTKQAQNTITGATTPVGTTIKQAQNTPAGTISTIVGATIKQARKTVTGATTPAGANNPVEAVQVAKPSSDIAVGNWTSTGANYYTEVDDPTGSPDNSDYVFTGLTGSEIQLGIQSVTDPADNVRHRIFYALDVSSGTHDIRLRLREGATQRASWDVTSVTGFYFGYYELSTAEADAITNYGNLRITAEKI